MLNPSMIPSAFIIDESDSSPYGADILNPSVIPSACSSVNRSRHHTELTFLNPLVIPSVKKPAITSTSANRPLFFILNILSISSLVFTDGLFPSIYADNRIDGLNSVSNGDLKLPTELFCQKCRWY
jgi:hypothetical protein